MILQRAKPAERGNLFKFHLVWFRLLRLSKYLFLPNSPDASAGLIVLLKSKDYQRMNVMIPHMEIPGLSSDAIKWLQIQAYLKFYLKPRRPQYWEGYIN
jgi:hypothetical protein